MRHPRLAAALGVTLGLLHAALLVSDWPVLAWCLDAAVAMADRR